MATNPVPKVMWVSPPGVTSIPCELPLKNQNVTDTCATRKGQAATSTICSGAAALSCLQPTLHLPGADKLKRVSVGTCRMRRFQVGSTERWAEPVMGSVLLGDSPGVPSPAAAAPALGCFVLPLTMTILY
ncbi:hypothetical protein Q9966_004321 [Columba livia]|nr:hypothetical protein Q9966_004321 [Columba livia]